jgi:hypothetical protein
VVVLQVGPGNHEIEVESKDGKMTAFKAFEHRFRMPQVMMMMMIMMMVVMMMMNWRSQSAIQHAQVTWCSIQSPLR